MSKQLVHYGQMLKENVERLGIPTSRVLEITKIKDARTLVLRYADSKFSFDQLRALKEKGLL